MCLSVVVLLEEHMVAVVMAMVTIDRSVFGIYWAVVMVDGYYWWSKLYFFHSVVLHRRSKNKKRDHHQGQQCKVSSNDRHTPMSVFLPSVSYFELRFFYILSLNRESEISVLQYHA
jgi:hypothetical protein